MFAPPKDKQIWEWSAKQFRKYRAYLMDMHERWELSQAFRKAVLENDSTEILRLAPKVLEELIGEVEYCGLPPKTQPKNRAEAMAALELIQRGALCKQ